MNIAIIYTSMSGNTEELSEVIADTVKKKRGTCTMIRAGALPSTLSQYDVVLFGTYTWGKGSIPKEMRDALRTILKETKMTIQEAAVFGTGDQNFPHFCRAVDETFYHLNHYNVNVVAEVLKIEQSCRGSQTDSVFKWTEKVLNGGMSINATN